jgi:hypothetical protein
MSTSLVWMVLLRISIVCCLFFSLSMVESSLASSYSGGMIFIMFCLFICDFIERGAFTVLS